jgi:hypothetical protein
MSQPVPLIVSRANLLADQVATAANALNILTPVITYTVPRGKVWEPDASRPLIAQLQIAETIAAPGTHAAFSVTYPICRTLRVDGVGVGDATYNKVLLLADGTVRTITAAADHIDTTTTAGTFTCSDESAADHRCVYVPWAAGELEIRAVAPGNAGEISRTLFRRPARTLFEVNQWKDGFPLVWGVPLPENFKIQVLLRAAWIAAFTSGTTLNAVDLPYSDVRVPVLESFMGEWPSQHDLSNKALDWIGGH